jgi:Ca-activated chloride channel family protein
MQRRIPFRRASRFASFQGTGAPRVGAMLVLISAFLVVVLAMTLFTVDVAYMQLTRSELRASTDAASKAGAEALRRTKNPNAARQAAIDVAARNTIGGQPLLIRDSDIELGSVVRTKGGTWDFQEGLQPYTAVRVNSEMGGTSLNNPVRLFFADFFGSGTFEPVRSSTAAHTATEIMLVLDRSHSMCWDLSGVSWQYPPGTPKLPHPIAYPPHPTLSRWGVLMKAVKDFTKAIKKQDPQPRVGLVTWGSKITLANYEGALTGLTFPAVDVDLKLAPIGDLADVKVALRALKPMLGGTDMSAGIDQGVKELTAPTVDPLAARVMILMSDGEWNHGRDPVEAARDAKARSIIIHTIAFSPQAEAETLRQIADITGGRFYSATNGDELSAAFEEIARQLPVLLVD